MNLVCSYCGTPAAGVECVNCGSTEREQRVEYGFCPICGSTVTGPTCTKCTSQIVSAPSISPVSSVKRKAPRRFLAISLSATSLVVLIGVTSSLTHKGANHAIKRATTTTLKVEALPTSVPTSIDVATTIPRRATTTTIWHRTTTTLRQRETTTTVPPETTTIQRATTTTVKVVTRADLIAHWKSSVSPLVDTLQNYYNMGAVYANIQSAEDNVYPYFNDAANGSGGLPSNINVYGDYISVVSYIYNCYSPVYGYPDQGQCSQVPGAFDKLRQTIANYS